MVELLIHPLGRRVECLPLVAPLEHQDPLELEGLRLVVDLVDVPQVEPGPHDHRPGISGSRRKAQKSRIGRGGAGDPPTIRSGHDPGEGHPDEAPHLCKRVGAFQCPPISHHLPRHRVRSQLPTLDIVAVLRAGGRLLRFDGRADVVISQGNRRGRERPTRTPPTGAVSGPQSRATDRCPRPEARSS